MVANGEFGGTSTSTALSVPTSTPPKLSWLNSAATVGIPIAATTSGIGGKSMSPLDRLPATTFTVAWMANFLTVGGQVVSSSKIGAKIAVTSGPVVVVDAVSANCAS